MCYLVGAQSKWSSHREFVAEKKKFHGEQNVSKAPQETVDQERKAFLERVSEQFE